MSIQEKQLAQARENSTNAVSVYSPGSGITAIIKTIILCNQSGSAATARIFIDDDGTTYDESTAILFDVDVPVGESIILNTFIAMNNQNGNLAYRSSVANAITITIFGAELT